jgi:hypothetical protein
MKKCLPISGGCSIEWFVTLLSATLAGLVYVFSMPPTVTMNSGAYITASFDFGVPIPPGYPFWTVCGFLWSHFILPVGNPAWRLSMMSAAAGASMVGALALTMFRSTIWLISALPWGKAIEANQLQWIAAFTGIGTALLFGFDRVVWQWACAPEPQALYILLYFLAVANFYNWIRNPNRRYHLYATVMFLSLTVATADLNSALVTAVMASPFFLAALATGIEAANERRHDADASGGNDGVEKL